MNKDNMAILLESPPFMPIDERTREIWAMLLDFCPNLFNIKIVKYEPKKSITISGDYFGEFIEKTVDIMWAFRETPKIDIGKLMEKINND